MPDPTDIPKPTPADDGDPDAEWAEFLSTGDLDNHWDRPWPAGEHAYYWYLRFTDPAVVDLARRCQDALRLPVLDPVPLDTLHLTIQRIGTLDDITPAVLDAVVERTRDRCREVLPFRLTVGPLTGSRSALRFTVRPWKPVVDLRALTRSVLADVLGADRVPRPENDFRPHIGTAYLNAPVPVAEIADRIRPLRDLPVAEMTVTELHLVDLTRTDHAYQPRTVATVPLV